MWKSWPSSATSRVGTPLVLLAVGVLVAAALANLAPPTPGWGVPLLALAVAAGLMGLRGGGGGWWFACGALLGGAACAWAPRVPVPADGRGVAVRFVATVRDGWGEGIYGRTNRVRLEALEDGRGPLAGFRELPVEVGGSVPLAELPPPGARIEGSGELWSRAGRPLERPLLRVKSALVLRRLDGGSRLDRLRDGGVRALLQAAGTDVRRIDAAALAAALTLGRRELLRPGEVGTLRSAGLAHLLAVSGLHVGLVGFLVWALLLLAPLSPPQRRMVLAVALVGFAVVSGGFAPVRRAAGAAVAYLLARQLGRPLEPLPTVWAIVAGLVLVEPGVLLAPGFQLSAGVTLALIRWVRPMARALAVAPRPVANAVAVAVVAQAAAAPLQGVHFGYLPPLAVVANLAASPVTAAVTGCSLVAALTAPAVPTLGGALLDGVAVAASVLDRLAAATSLSVRPFPPPPWPLLLGFAAVAVWALSRTRFSTVAAVGTVAGVIFWVVGVPARRPATAELHMLPVGEGMALLLRTPAASLLVDAGRAPREAARALAAMGVRRLDAVVLTHLDADHVGGAGMVLEWLRPRQLVLTAHAADGSEAAALQRLARQRQIRERRVSTGQRFRIGDVVVDVLWPDSGFRGSDNDASLVAAVRWHDVRVLVTGDLEAWGERALLARGAPLQASVLQLGHHGSATSSTAAFLAAVDPVIAVAATGERPRHRYPHPDTLRRLRTRRTVVVAQKAGVHAILLADAWLIVGTREPVRVRLGRGRV